MQLGLGGVFFGLDYGRRGQRRLDYSAARELVAFAERSGIALIDTAAAYGDSESVLGEALADIGWAVRVATKVSSGVEGDDPVGHVMNQARASSGRLLRDHLDVLLLHDIDVVAPDAWPTLRRQLREVKDSGVASMVGASFYDPTILRDAVEQLPIDVAQVPLSVLDQRFVPHIAELRSAGIEVHTRSVLMQGLLAGEAELAPSEVLRAAIRRFHDARTAAGLTVEQAALAPSTDVQVDVVIVGAHSPAELGAFVNAAADSSARFDWRPLAVSGPAVDPRLW